MGFEPTDNELGVLEIMQLFVEVLDKYFKGANELDIMFRYLEFISIVLIISLNRCHILLDEMIMNGDVIETNSANILASLTPIDEYFKQQNS